MTRDALIELLNYYKEHGAGEEGHIKIDEALLAYINDEEVSAIHAEIDDMWYA